MRATLPRRCCAALVVIMTSRLSAALLLAWPFTVGAAETILEQLERNRALWDSLSIVSYQYTIDFEGPYAALDLPPMDVTVKDNALESASQKVAPHRFLECVFPTSKPELCDRGDETATAQTIPQLFDSLSSFVASLPDDVDLDKHLVLTFDVKYGFPKRFSFWDPRVSDSGGGFSINRFSEL